MRRVLFNINIPQQVLWRLLSLVATFLVAISPVSAGDSILDLEDYQGKVVIVDFWASWCVPCRRSFPWLDEMQKKYAADGLVVVGVNMDADQADANGFLQAHPVGFRIVQDPDGMLARRYDVIAMPSSYVIDRSGEIVARHLGFKVARQQEYEATLLSVLQETTERQAQ